MLYSSIRKTQLLANFAKELDDLQHIVMDRILNVLYNSFHFSMLQICNPRHYMINWASNIFWKIPTAGNTNSYRLGNLYSLIMVERNIGRSITRCSLLIWIDDEKFITLRLIDDGSIFLHTTSSFGKPLWKLAWLFPINSNPCRTEKSTSLLHGCEKWMFWFVQILLHMWWSTPFLFFAESLLSCVVMHGRRHIK